jgi:hypothetical protein
MAGNSRKIRDAIVSTLTGLVYLSEPAFVSIKTSTQGEFNGYPSLRVMPDPLGIENKPSEMSQNDRTVTTSVLGHILLEDTPDSEDVAINRMLDLTDLIIDALDKADYEQNLPDLDLDSQSYVLNADRAEWTFADSSAGAILLFLVNVHVTYSKDLDSDA